MRKRLLLVLGLGLIAQLVPRPVNAGSSPAASDQFRAEATKVALHVIGERLGADATKLSVVAVSDASYVYLGQAVLVFKIADSRGRLHGVAVNADLRAVDPEKLAAEDRAARASRFGVLDPALAARLVAGVEDKLGVIVWVVDRASRPVNRPRPHGKRVTPARIDGYYTATDEARAAALKTLMAPVLARVRRFDPSARAETLSPLIAATLAPEALRALASDPDIDRIYLDLRAEQELGVAKATTGITQIQGAGTLGDGVRIAMIEAEGRVESASLLLRPVVQDGLNVCPTVSDHSTSVAGVIKERRLNPFGTPIGEEGAAPNVDLRVGGSCSTNSVELMDASSRAANWGARAINLSWGLDTRLALGGTDRFYDDMTFNRWRTIVKSAGNRGCATPGDPASGPGSGLTTSPGLAFNVITVGGFDDNDTTSWSDDSMYACTSFANPISTHGDREKPELVAPAVNINVVTSGPANLVTVSGTSGAAPLVTSTIALLIQRNGVLSVWPEILRATLMATAIHNLEGSTRLSDMDGAGGLVANEAAGLVGDPRRTGGLWYTCDGSTPTPLNLATLSVGPRTRQRVVLSWDTDPAFADYETRPSVDIDLRVVDSLGRSVASSLSFDNAYEIVDFDSWTAGTYTVQAVKFRCDLPTWLGWAWHTLPILRSP